MKSLRYDVPRAEYDAIAGVNWSRLKSMLRSPAHYRHRMLNWKDQDTAAKKRGRAVHMAVLEPQRFTSEYAIWTGGRRQGKAWDAYRAENQSREILSEAELEECMAISQAVNAAAGELMAGGRREVTLQWEASAPALAEMPGWKIDCKSRLDFVSPRTILDLKVTRDGHPSAFGADVWRYRHDCQAAFYVDGYKAVTGVELPYVLVAVEAEPPHVVTLYRVTDEQLDHGRKTYRELLERVDFCTRENVWPGYAEGETALVLPHWAAPQLDLEEDITGLDLVVNE